MKPTILATAYAINPFKGSEDGMGWNFVRQIAKNHKVYAVTRKNNREAIEAYFLENPVPEQDNMHFIYYDLPYWARFWKRGQHGALLYYYLWQFFLPGFIRRKNLEFDIAHNLNFHNDWTPSFLWKLGKPFVWGPVGHHPGIPFQYLKHFPFRYWLKEWATRIVKHVFWNFSPTLSNSNKKAKAILAMNSQAKVSSKAVRYTMPSVACEEARESGNTETKQGFKLLSAGRLVPLKGFDLSLEAFAKFVQTLDPTTKSKVHLTIVGAGPELNRLKEQITQHQLNTLVTIKAWMPREELLELYHEASAFLFPSHEGAGMVVAEALSHGVPVVCLDNSGPGEFIAPECGIKVTASSRSEAISRLSEALTRLHTQPQLLKELSLGAEEHFQKHFHWDRRGETLSQIYRSIA